MAALLLAQQGVRTLVVDRREGPHRAPQAHVVNPRTLEICRAAGVDMARLRASATRREDGSHVVWMTRLACEELGRLPYERQGDAQLRYTPTPLLNLSAITSGRPSGSIGESYNDHAFAAMLEKLRPKYDMIFIDAPPIVPVVEPLMMAEHVDSVLVVAMAGRTPLMMVRRMRQLIEPIFSKISGVVLNNAVEGLPYYYDYRYYGYAEQPSARGASRTPRATGTTGGLPPGAGTRREGGIHGSGHTD